MTAAAADTVRVVLLAPEDSVAASVRSALEQAGLAQIRWEPADEAAAGRPPVDPDMLILQTDGADIAGLLRRGQGEGWLGTGIPIVVLATRTVNRDERREWLRAGAWEIIRLPLDEELFGLQVRNFLRALHAPSGYALEEEPYEDATLLRVAEENLALALRQRRPLCVAAFGLDWGTRRADADALALMERLAVTAHDAVRGSDLVGVTPRGSLLIILPETEMDGARVFIQRVQSRLQSRLREWGVAARVLTGAVPADLDDAPPAADLLASAERSIT